MMTSAQVVETSVTTTDNSPSFRVRQIRLKITSKYILEDLGHLLFYYPYKINFAK